MVSAHSARFDGMELLFFFELGALTFLALLCFLLFYLCINRPEGCLSSKWQRKKAWVARDKGPIRNDGVPS